METLLVLTDFSKRSENAAEYALQLACKLHAHLLLYNVIFQVLPVPEAIGPNLYYESVNAIEKYSKIQLENLEFKLKQLIHFSKDGCAGINSVNDIGNLGSSVQFLLNRRDIAMIVMGSKGHENMYNSFLFTTETNEVLEKSSAPILMIPERSHYREIRKIAYAADFDKTNFAAIRYLVEIAAVFKAEIVLVHVTAHQNNHIDYAEEFHKLKKKFGYAKISYESIPGDDIPLALNKFSKLEKIDILSIAPKKRAFIDRMLHESLTEATMEYQFLPLLVFPVHFKHDKSRFT